MYSDDESEVQMVKNVNDNDDEDLLESDGHSNNTVTGYCLPDRAYDPLVKLIGVQNMNFMDDEGFHPSGSSDSFAYINRQCGSHVSKR